MKALAGWIMAGRMQAIMAATVAAMLALVVAPLGVVAGAVVALVTLRAGPREGVLVALGATLAMTLLGGVILQQASLLGFVALLLFLPVLLMAVALRATVLLRSALEVGLGLAALMLIVQYALLADPAQFWQEVLLAIMESAGGELVPSSERAEMAAAVAPWVPGLLAAGWFLQLAVTLFLGRWWQALLYNPGGFGSEYRQLRLGRWSLFALPVLLLLGVGGQATWSQLLAMPVVVAHLFQGIALAHATVHHYRAGPGWLFGLYFLLGVGGMASLLVMAASGYLDGWVDVRRRLGMRDAGADGSN